MMVDVAVADPFMRQGNETDIVWVAELERVCFDKEIAWGADGLLAEFRLRGSRLLVIRRIAALLYRKWGSRLYVNSLAVHPDHRRQGLASSLLCHALLEVRLRRGGSSAHLLVEAGNESAIALYEHHGFVVEGRRHDFYCEGKDALEMKLVMNGG